MWITVATPPFKSVEQFDSVRSATGEEPDGLEARYVGTTDGGLRIVCVWVSKDHADRFFSDTLGPALAKALGPEPGGPAEVIGIDVQRSYVGERVA